MAEVLCSVTFRLVLGSIGLGWCGLWGLGRARSALYTNRVVAFARNFSDPDALCPRLVVSEMSDVRKKTSTFSIVQQSLELTGYCIKGRKQ